MIVNYVSKHVSKDSMSFATSQYNSFLHKHKLEPDTEFVNFKHDYLVLEPGLTHLDFADCLTEGEYNEYVSTYSDDAFCVVPFHPISQLAILHHNKCIADEVYNNPKYYE